MAGKGSKRPLGKAGEDYLDASKERKSARVMAGGGKSKAGEGRWSSLGEIRRRTSFNRKGKEIDSF